MGEPTNLLVLEDGHIRSMMGDQRFTDAFPCLGAARRNYEQRLPGCTRCNQKKARLLSDTMGQIKRCLTSLSGSKRVELKRLLNAKQVRLFKPIRGGKVKVTF